jgi:hypothetical protein
MPTALSGPKREPLIEDEPLSRASSGELTTSLASIASTKICERTHMSVEAMRASLAAFCQLIERHRRHAPLPYG